jgi:hypothetical protein
MTDAAHISFLCPHCQKPVHARAELAGASIRCPDQACAQVCVVPAPHGVQAEQEADRPKKKRRQRRGEEGSPGAKGRRRNAYRVLSEVLLLHLAATGLVYLGLLLLVVSLGVSLWAGTRWSAPPELADDEGVVREVGVLDPEKNVTRRLVIVERKGSKTWEVYTLDPAGNVVNRREVPAGSALDEADADAGPSRLRLAGLVWAALALAVLAALLDLGLLVVPDGRARLLLLGALLTRPVPALLLLTLFKAQHSVLALFLLALALFGSLSCGLMFLRRIGDLRDAAGVAAEAKELITVGGVTILMATLMLACLIFPFSLFSVGVVWGGLSSGVVKMGLVESIPMAVAFPFGIPFLLRYLNLINGVRGCLP